ncbi:MAG: FAD-dependent oxidoreductase [Pseudomonadota bacterium]
MTRLAIIGAGLAGLTAAILLRERAAHITIFEKSRGLGGRMATRRADPFIFDHGAQFFTAKTPAFQAFIAPMIEAGVLQRWDARFTEFEGPRAVATRTWGADYPHYVPSPGMNAMGAYLARGLDIRKDQRIVKTRRDSKAGAWHLTDETSTESGPFDWLICAIPAPQAVQILPSCFAHALENVPMRACFSLMLGFDTPLSLEFDAALVREMDISWISANSSKPGRKNPFCLLVHSTNRWAQLHIDQNREEVMAYLLAETSRIIGPNVHKARHKAVHGWRYANIDKQEGPTCHTDLAQNLIACGDWCLHGRIEAAFLSGLAAAQTIKDDPASP